MMRDESGYLRRSKRGKAKRKMSDMVRVFMVKPDSHNGGAITIGRVLFPVEHLGKRFKVKFEEVL